MSILDITGIDLELADRLAVELQDVGCIFDRQLASEYPPVNALSVHVSRYRGKMLRPILVLLSGMATHHTDEDLDHQLRTLAAVCEMIHMATLVHDDVLDESSIRRGGPTINSLHGNDMAVMLGDYLISNAFHLCSTLNRPDINLLIGRVTNTLCEGEIVQLHHRDRLDLDEDLYFSIIERKTASLIGCCTEIGSIVAGSDPDQQRAMRQYGIDLGIAFQITDDLLDLTGSQNELGKSVGRDLDMGKLTLPLIRALNTGDESIKRSITALVRDRCHAQLRELLQSEGWFESAQSTASERVRSAQEQLHHLVDSPARHMLHLMADAVLDRKV